MKTIAIRLTVAIACSSLLLLGCSKSNKSAPAANNGDSTAASSANGGSAPSGPVTLKVKWLTGKKYDMEMDLNRSMDMKIPGQPQTQETVTKLTQGLQYSPLKDLDSGGHQVELQITRQNLDITQNGKEFVSYDSTQSTPIEPGSPSAPVAAAMQAMMGAPLDYTIGADGTVEKIDGIDSMTSRIAAAVPDQRQRASLQQLYDENTLKQYGEFSESLPDHPINVGDSWTSSQDINTPIGVITADSTYTFKNWEQHNGHNCVHILITSVIKSKTSTAATIGIVVKIQKGTATGDAWFDPDLGMFVDINTGQDLALDFTTRQMEFSGRQKQSVELSLIGVNP
ncbi:MAG TPA: DUF6263 family protein [Candidatus Sulfotelmatobacter sp.]|nr:DUF6263 family protein [Candidatus Sulfotelmatobacter sp.]